MPRVTLAARPLPCLTLALCLFGLTPAAPALAQEELVGSWRIDVERSDPPRRDGTVIDNSMEISLFGDDVQVDRTWRFNGQELPITITYVTDGKPHEVPNPRGGVQEARARYKKGKLTVSYTTSFGGPRGSIDIDITETWRREGDELEIGYSARLPQDRLQTRKEIYVSTEPSPLDG